MGELSVELLAYGAEPVDDGVDLDELASQHQHRVRADSPDVLPARRHATNGRTSSRPKPTSSSVRISRTTRSSASS